MSRRAQNSGRRARKLEGHSKAPEIRQTSPPGEREDYERYSVPASAAINNSGIYRSHGTTPDKGQSAPDVEDDRLPPWREKGLKKRANVLDMTASPLYLRRGHDLRGCRLHPYGAGHFAITKEFYGQASSEQDIKGRFGPDSRLIQPFRSWHNNCCEYEGNIRRRTEGGRYIAKSGSAKEQMESQVRGFFTKTDKCGGTAIRI